MHNDKFIYNEKTSDLFAPDGTLIKRVNCPKSMHWNQLKVDDEKERWRGCAQCRAKVVNLDALESRAALKVLSKSGATACVHGSEEGGRVIFLKDRFAPTPPAQIEAREDGLKVIKTARSPLDINRAVRMGYWPDVRFIEFDTKNLVSHVSVGQHMETGEIQLSGDYRLSFSSFDKEQFSELKQELERVKNKELKRQLQQDLDEMKWIELIPFRVHYPYFQPSPIAAYLVPKGLSDQTPVLVEDPIEDFVGAVWNQGSARAVKLKGIWKDKRIVIEPPVKGARRRFVG